MIFFNDFLSDPYFGATRTAQECRKLLVFIFIRRNEVQPTKSCNRLTDFYR